MKYTDCHLNGAVVKGIFTEEQVDNFKNYVSNTNTQPSGLLNILYYGGGLLIISALTWLMKSSWDSFGAKGIVFFSSVYFISFIIAGYIVFFKKNMTTPGGILFSMIDRHVFQ